MRLTVRRVVEAVPAYPDREELFRNYPDLEEQDVRQALEFAAADLTDEVSETAPASQGSSGGLIPMSKNVAMNGDMAGRRPTPPVQPPRIHLRSK